MTGKWNYKGIIPALVLPLKKDLAIDDQELRRLAGPKAPVEGDDAAIRKQLLALRELDERATVELRQAYDSLDEVLDARQQARFRMFEEHIEQRKLDLLIRARERARAARQLSDR